MTPVRCSVAACTRLGEHFEPDGRWWFCDSCFDMHLSMRRAEREQTRQRKTTASRVKHLHGFGLTDAQIAERMSISASQVGVVRRSLKLPRHQPNRCGTPAGHERHRSRGEKPCDACITARREYDAARYLRRKAGRDRAA